MYETERNDLNYVITAGSLHVHSVANQIPMPISLDYLKSAIERNGLLEPITLYAGEIIDGRCRASVCQDLGIKIQAIDLFEKLGNQTLKQLNTYVHDKFTRRNLLPAQRAMIAAKACIEKKHKLFGLSKINYASQICDVRSSTMDRAIYILKANRQYADELYNTGYAKINNKSLGLTHVFDYLKEQEYLLSVELQDNFWDAPITKKPKINPYIDTISNMAKQQMNNGNYSFEDVKSQVYEAIYLIGKKHGS
jgi:hypothetical protein